MFGLRKVLSTFLLVVAILVLVSIATTVYNANTGKKNDLTPSELAQKGGVAVVNAVGVSSKYATQDIETNNGFGQKVVGLFKMIDWKTLVRKLSTSSDAIKTTEAKEIPVVGQNPNSGGIDNSSSSSFLDKLTNFVKDEWNNSHSSSTSSTSSENISLDNINAPQVQEAIRTKVVGKFIELQKNDRGIDIILKLENSGEYKILVPFKFLRDFIK